MARPDEPRKRRDIRHTEYSPSFCCYLSGLSVPLHNFMIMVSSTGCNSTGRCRRQSSGKAKDIRDHTARSETSVQPAGERFLEPVSLRRRRSPELPYHRTSRNCVTESGRCRRHNRLIPAGVGAEIRFSDGLSPDISAGANYSLTDNLNYYKVGDPNDAYSTAGLALIFGGSNEQWRRRSRRPDQQGGEATRHRSEDPGYRRRWPERWR